MANEEKVYTIPLRKKWVKAGRIDRANVSVDTIRAFLKRHTKSEDVKLSPLLNESLWARGAKKPPAFSKVKVVKDEKGIVNAMMPEERLEITEKKGLKQKLLRKEGKKESKVVLGDKALPAETSTTGKEIKKADKPTEDKKAEPKKEDVKETKKKQ